MPTQLDRIENQINRLELRISQLANLVTATLTGDQIIMSKLEDLEAAVAAETTVVNSAVTLLNGVTQRIVDAVAAARAGDDNALTALATEVASETAALAAAVAANTPGQPPG